MLFVRKTLDDAGKADSVPMRAVVHTDSRIGVLRNATATAYSRMPKQELREPVFRRYLSEAASELVANADASQHLWRTYPFTAPAALLPKLSSPSDHELLILRCDWTRVGCSNELIRMPAVARYPDGWVWKIASPNDETTARKAADALARGPWRVLRNQFRDLEVLPTSVWHDIFGADSTITVAGDRVTVLNVDFNAPGTIRAIRGRREGILTRGNLSVSTSFLCNCSADIAVLLSRIAGVIGELFYGTEQPGQMSSASSIVAFARRLGIGPSDSKRKREFESNLPRWPRGNVLHRPCAHSSRFTDDPMALQCRSLTLCGQPPDQAAKQSPGQVLAILGHAPPCMLPGGQYHWNNGRRFEAAAETRKAKLLFNPKETKRRRLSTRGEAAKNDAAHGK